MSDEQGRKLIDLVEEQKPDIAKAVLDPIAPADPKALQPTGPGVAPGSVTHPQVPEESHNNAGFQSRDDYLVHIGRGHDTSGRGSQKG